MVNRPYTEEEPSILVLAGGWVLQNFGWRSAFFLVGLPGIFLALVLKLTVREPQRGAASGHHQPVLRTLGADPGEFLSQRAAGGGPPAAAPRAGAARLRRLPAVHGARHGTPPAEDAGARLQVAPDAPFMSG